MEVVQTNIDGLMIRLNKVVSDKRGFLGEMAPLGLNDPFLKAGVKNIYTAVAVEKHVARAGHLHKKNIENFFVLSGTALWLLVDCREDSPTFNKYYFGIFGSKKPSFETDTSFYTIDDSKLAQILIPNGVYHIFWPLTDEKVTALAIASETYDKEDYISIDLEKYPEVKSYLAKFGIGV